ncbi:hypothetical protein C8R46DRAFT_1285687 [Mycena filopes]|nr:hypothetical protein C8R46DRAFT_1285687 [Mycena filopes]
MVLEPSGSSNGTLLALFRRAALFLDRDDNPPAVVALQERFLESFSKRVDPDDIESMDLLSIAHTLLLTPEDKQTLLQTLHLLGASAVEQNWFTANIDQANHFIKVLVGGNRTPYPDVDGASYSDANGAYTHHLRSLLSRLRGGTSGTAMLDRFSAVAEIHHLNDQGRLAENLDAQSQENVPALEYARSIKFSEYTYGAVVILGHSPTAEEARKGTACSQMTKDKITRCVGLNRERQKFAPLYIVCGGSVRPQLTRINEGLSMKKYMVENYGIPAHQVLVDATSEHMYSNFMNAVLLAREANMPEGTKLGVFLVPDRYGNEDQYKFCVTRMWRRAGVEVFPAFDGYFSMAKGTEDRAIEIVLGNGSEDFLSPILLWRDYTGELKGHQG